MKQTIIHYFNWLVIMILPSMLLACSPDYRNVVPAGSIAIVSLDIERIASQNNVGDNRHKNAMQSLLNIDDISDSGIDLMEKVYAFEAADGSLGMVFSIDNSNSVEGWFDKLNRQGTCSKITERKGYKFAVLHNNFLAGFSDNALLIMGPVVSTSVKELQNQMVKYLGADEDEGMMGSVLFSKLDSIDCPVALVARAQALPEKFAAPFMLGAPKNASPNDIVISASIDIDKECLMISGETFSFNNYVNKALKTSSNIYHHIGDKYLRSISSEAMLTLLCNVDGDDFIRQLRNNDTFRTMLVGLNTAIDIDQMLKSVDGDMSITILPQAATDKFDFSIIADISGSPWLQDVDYWKKSSPAGTRIENWEEANCFHYTSADWNVYFGLTKDSSQLFIRSTDKLSNKSQFLYANGNEAMVRRMSGMRLCAIINIEVLTRQSEELKAVKKMLEPIAGDLKTIIYTIK